MEVSLPLMLFSPVPDLLPLILVIDLFFFLEGEPALGGHTGDESTEVGRSHVVL